MVPSLRRANQNCLNRNKRVPQNGLDESATTQICGLCRGVLSDIITHVHRKLF